MKQKHKKRQRRKIPWNSECQLLAVTELGSINNIANKLPLVSMHKITYKSIFDLYNNFRKNVPDRRLALAISKDDTDENPMYVLDTQLIDKKIKKGILTGSYPTLRVSKKPVDENEEFVMYDEPTYH